MACKTKIYGSNTSQNEGNHKRIATLFIAERNVRTEFEGIKSLKMQPLE